MFQALSQGFPNFFNGDPKNAFINLVTLEKNNPVKRCILGLSDQIEPIFLPCQSFATPSLRVAD